MRKRFLLALAAFAFAVGALALLVAVSDAFSFTLGASATALLVLAAALFMRRSRAATEEAIRESEARLRLVADNVPALISYIDREQRFRFSNRTYDDWFSLAHEQMAGRTVDQVFGAEAYERMRGHFDRVLAGEEVEFELAIAAGGRHRTLQVSCVPHFTADQQVAGFYMLANDVTALKQLAYHDPLTGIPNRAMFADRAREAVTHARRHGKRAAVLFLDLDDFKQVNDQLGHETGDALLKLIASRVRASVRGDDFVARIGGDEFCVLLQDIADGREAAAVAQKLVQELGKPYRLGERSVTSGVSVGIACVPQDGEDVATLLHKADMAMYQAKRKGSSDYQFFSGVPNDRIRSDESPPQRVSAQR